MPLPDLPDSINPAPFSTDSPETLFLLTSLTSGSSTIITATSRLEHLLKSHKIPFKAVDVATDDKARQLWGRRGKGKRLPGVVKDGMVLGNYEDLDEWNEYGELKQNLGLVQTTTSQRTTDLSGKTYPPLTTTAASPNIIPEPQQQQSQPLAGTAGVAAAAAAVAKGMKKADAGGIRGMVGREKEKEVDNVDVEEENPKDPPPTPAV